MKPTEVTLTRLLRSRPGTLVMCVMAFAAIFASYGLDALSPADVTFDRWPQHLFSSSALLSLCGNTLMLAAIMAAMVYINRTYNLLRSTTLLFVGLFIVMQAATPAIATRLTWGTILCFAVLACQWITYTTYQNTSLTRRIFLTFCILAAGTLLQYGFAPYLIVFLIGMMQMRSLTPRSLLAALVGIATPVWIAWGFGFLDLGHITLPRIEGVWTEHPSILRHPLFVAGAISWIAALMFTIVNLIRVYSLNASTRAINGLLSVITLVTMILCVVDFGNLTTYLTLLNCCAAMQTTLFFRFYAERRGYIPIVILLVAYTAIYIWNIWI